MSDPLTAALVEPAQPVDDTAWRAALHEVKATLAGLAVRRAGARTFRVTDHEVRVALGRADETGEKAGADPTGHVVLDVLPKEAGGT